MPSLLVASCPHCRAKYKVQPKAAGRNTTCARCHKRFKISALAAADYDVQPEDAFDLDSDPKDEIEYVAVKLDDDLEAEGDASDDYDFGDDDDFSEDYSAGEEDDFGDDDFADDDFADDEFASSEYGDELPDLPAPEKKKKKKRKKESGFNPVIPLVIGSICVMGVAVMLLVPLLKNLEFGGGSGIEPPETYARHLDSLGNQFGIDYPDGWKVEFGARGGTSNPWARFTHEDSGASIRVKTSLGASAMFGDAIPGSEIDIPMELKRCYQAHEFMRDQFADEYSNYEDQRAEIVKTGFGESCLTEFTARGTWGGGIKGVRMSALGKNYQITVICDCSEADWEVLGPVFRHAATSLGRR